MTDFQCPIYKKTEALVASTNDYKKLCALETNIRKRIATDPSFKNLVRLADNAEFKAKLIRLLERCPSPINDSMLEQIAFNNFVEGAATLDKTPSSRVIHHQLKKLGYAKTMAKQVENEVGNKVFFEMAAKGIVRHTSEYFIFKYAKHLTNPKTYNKIAEFFKNNEELLVGA